MPGERGIFPDHFYVLEKGAAGHGVLEGQGGGMKLGSHQGEAALAHSDLHSCPQEGVSGSLTLRSGKGTSSNIRELWSHRKKGWVMRSPAPPPPQGCTQESVRDMSESPLLMLSGPAFK